MASGHSEPPPIARFVENRRCRSQKSLHLPLLTPPSSTNANPNVNSSTTANSNFFETNNSTVHKFQTQSFFDETTGQLAKPSQYVTIKLPKLAPPPPSPYPIQSTAAKSGAKSALKVQLSATKLQKSQLRNNKSKLKLRSKTPVKSIKSNQQLGSRLSLTSVTSITAESKSTTSPKQQEQEPRTGQNQERRWIDKPWLIGVAVLVFMLVFCFIVVRFFVEEKHLPVAGRLVRIVIPEANNQQTTSATIDGAAIAFMLNNSISDTVLAVMGVNNNKTRIMAGSTTAKARGIFKFAKKVKSWFKKKANND